MAKYDNNKDRYYLEPGDVLIASDVFLIVDKDDNFKLGNMEDATIHYWDKDTDDVYKIHYATDIPKNDPNYGQAYYGL